MRNRLAQYRLSETTQLKVGLPEGMRIRLDAAAAEAGHSLAEEVRRRVVQSLQDEISLRASILRFQVEVGLIISLAEAQCGHHWDNHPATAHVMQLAIEARLARYEAREGLKFSSGELPDVRPVAAGSDDSEAMAIGIEAVIHNRTDVNERFRPLEAHRLEERNKILVSALQARLRDAEQAIHDAKPRKKETLLRRINELRAELRDIEATPQEKAKSDAT